MAPEFSTFLQTSFNTGLLTMHFRALAVVALLLAVSIPCGATEQPKRTLLLRVDQVRLPSLLAAGVTADEYHPASLLTLVRDTALVLATDAEADTLRLHGLQVSVVMRDSSELTLVKRALYGPTGAMPSRYRTYARIVQELDSLARRFPRLVERFSIGTTAQEGRSIEAVRVSAQAGAQGKPAVLFNGCHHADEVMGAEICMALLTELTSRYATDPEVRAWVDSLNIVIVPVVNVDGYRVVTEGIDPRWRKNTRDTNRNGVLREYPEGVDLNRQYDFNWAFGGSGDSLSERYRGPFPFSESEARAVRDLALRERFLLSVTYHSQGEVVYYPWDWQGRKAPDDRVLTAMAQRLAGSIRTMRGDSSYRAEYGAGKVGQTYTWLYGRVGTFDFVVETGNGAHIFAPHEVEGIVQSNLQGARTILRATRGPGLKGNVWDAATGRPVEATVWFPEIDSEEIARRTTHPRTGNWWRLLLPGRYSVAISSPGFELFLRQNVVVGESGWTTLDVPLQRAGKK
jgi:hypothetical protein